MSDLSAAGRLLIAAGALLALAGLLLLFAGRLPGLGRLPGDVLIRRGGITVYVPIMTSIALSLLLTVVLNLLLRR